MIYTNKSELIRAIWENWQECRPEEEEERDKYCSSFIWDYMNRACQSEADRLCSLEKHGFRSIPELPGGEKVKAPEKRRTRKYSRLLALERLREDEIISEEEFYLGLEQMKKGITAKLGKEKEDQGKQKILEDLKFRLLKKAIEDFFTNNGMKLSNAGYGEDFPEDMEQGEKESVYEDFVWLFTEFTRYSRKSSSEGSGEANKAVDEAYIRECEEFYQLLVQNEDQNICRAVRQLFLPICIEPDTGMGVYLIGKDQYVSPQAERIREIKKQKGNKQDEKKERLCTVCLLQFTSGYPPQQIRGKQGERLRFLSVNYSVRTYEKDGDENVEKAVNDFVDFLNDSLKFQEYVDLNNCEKLRPSIPKSMLPYFWDADSVSPAEVAREAAKAIEEKRNQDEKKKEDQKNMERAMAFKARQDQKRKKNKQDQKKNVRETKT